MRLSLRRTAPALLIPLLLAGCATSKPVTYQPEEFNSAGAHTRNFDATQSQTCEAARRALLSQGYVMTTANAEVVTGRKSFQPAPEVHLEVELRVVCAADSGARDGHSTVAFASALQDRYAIKKVNNSASVGVGAFGSLSLPFSSSDDALVKVASETLTDEHFYDRFFGLVERYVPESAAGVPPEATAQAAAAAKPPPGPVLVVPAAAAPAPPTAPPAPAAPAAAPAAAAASPAAPAAPAAPQAGTTTPPAVGAAAPAATDAAAQPPAASAPN